jgi:hypothetical protein
MEVSEITSPAKWGASLGDNKLRPNPEPIQDGRGSGDRSFYWSVIAQKGINLISHDTKFCTGALSPPRDIYGHATLLERGHVRTKTFTATPRLSRSVSSSPARAQGVGWGWGGVGGSWPPQGGPGHFRPPWACDALDPYATGTSSNRDLSIDTSFYRDRFSSSGCASGTQGVLDPEGGPGVSHEGGPMT